MISHQKAVAEFVSEVWGKIISVIINNRAFIILTAFRNHFYTCKMARVPAAQDFIIRFTETLKF